MATETLNLLDERTRRILMKRAYYLCQDAGIAEDLVQETLTRAWLYQDQLKESTSMLGWLYTILQRENYRRFEKKRPDLLYCDEVVDWRLAELDFGQLVDCIKLLDNIQALTPSDAELLRLWFTTAIDTDALAGELGVNKMTAHTRLHRAVQRFKKAAGASAKIVLC